jgi:hypothetical protein
VPFAGRSCWLAGRVLAHIEAAADRAARRAERLARKSENLAQLPGTPGYAVQGTR